jgi:pSer/pThr/pTyr-binding forkhead associated (FHA) protein
MLTPAARLEVAAGNAVGMSILVEDEIAIGREVDGPGRLADDEEISRMHARVTVGPDGVCSIEDLGSTNGTYVNGLRISAPQVLSLGDMIELGQTTLSVRELPNAGEPVTAAQAPAIPPESAAPDPPAAAGAGPEDEPSAPPAPAVLSLQLEVDFMAREALLRLNDASEPMRLVFEAGAWRVHPSLPSEKGDPA